VKQFYNGDINQEPIIRTIWEYFNPERLNSEPLNLWRYKKTHRWARRVRKERIPYWQRKKK